MQPVVAEIRWVARQTAIAPVVVPMAAAMLGGQLAMGMLVVPPAIAIFLAMTLSLTETRGRELAVGNGSHSRQAA